MLVLYWTEPTKTRLFVQFTAYKRLDRNYVTSNNTAICGHWENNAVLEFLPHFTCFHYLSFLFPLVFVSELSILPSFGLHVFCFFSSLPHFRQPSSIAVMTHQILNHGEVHGWCKPKSQESMLYDLFLPAIPAAAFSSDFFLCLGVSVRWQWEFLFIYGKYIGIRGGQLGKLLHKCQQFIFCFRL